jgi:hypothetical protein
MRLVRSIVVPIFFVVAGSQCFAADKRGLHADEQTLRAATIGTDGPALLQLFRRHTLTSENFHKIAALIGQLGADDFEVREKATEDLASFGSAAGGLLRKALASSDVEVVRRLQQVMVKVGAGPGSATWSAATRVLAARKPKGAAATLLAYLPFAGDALGDDVRVALAALGVRDGKPAPVLVKALQDRNPLLRGAAGEALTRARAPGLQGDLRALLKDPDPTVRRRLALAFLALREREAVPVLIGLFGELPADQLWPVEDALYRLAGRHAPDLTAEKDVSPGHVRRLWTAWWKAHGSTLNLAEISRAPGARGYTVVATVSGVSGNAGNVTEFGRDGKQRWQLGDIVYPVDVRLLPSQRLLIAENPANRVTERDRKGAIFWEKRIALPVSCERLAGGTTFIATATQIVEVDRGGKEIFRYQAPKTKGKIIAARKLKNGEIVYVTNPGAVTRLDASGRLINSFPIGKVSYFASTIDVLPSGRILVPLYINDRVVEYDRDGKVVWEAHVVGAVSAFRLANGNTLVALPVRKVVVEIDRAGKEVAQIKVDGQPRQARRR